MRSSSHVRTQAGDTIVEVLIAVAVVSSVLVGAFSIANRSSTQIRASQERSEALKIASSAIEVLKANAGTAKEKAVLGQPVCATTGFVTKAMVDNGALPTLANDTTSKYVAACNSGGNVTYSTSVTPVDASTFRINTRWDRVGGGDRQEVIMNYRIKQ